MGCLERFYNIAMQRCSVEEYPPCNYEVGVEPAIGKEREDGLRDIHWKEMMQRGATMARFEPTQKSTSAILDILLLNSPIRVQALVDQRRSLKQSPQKPARNLNDVMDWLRRAFTGSRQNSAP